MGLWPSGAGLRVSWQHRRSLHICKRVVVLALCVYIYICMCMYSTDVYTSGWSSRNHLFTPLRACIEGFVADRRLDSSQPQIPNPKSRRRELGGDGTQDKMWDLRIWVMKAKRWPFPSLLLSVNSINNKNNSNSSSSRCSDSNSICSSERSIRTTSLASTMARTITRTIPTARAWNTSSRKVQYYCIVVVSAYMLAGGFTRNVRHPKP